MPTSELKLPTDIPWVRKCVSNDMMDDELCDTKKPFRWRSSLVVFEYQPAEEFQTYENLTISYLKVSCTITGYQEDPKEIGLKHKGFHDFWGKQPEIENYLDKLQKYLCLSRSRFGSFCWSGRWASIHRQISLFP